MVRPLLLSPFSSLTFSSFHSGNFSVSGFVEADVTSEVVVQSCIYINDDKNSLTVHYQGCLPEFIQPTFTSFSSCTYGSFTHVDLLFPSNSSYNAPKTKDLTYAQVNYSYIATNGFPLPPIYSSYYCGSNNSAAAYGVSDTAGTHIPRGEGGTLAPITLSWFDSISFLLILIFTPFFCFLPLIFPCVDVM